MPELPEIETIRHSLGKHVQGKEIARVEILLPRQIKWPEPAAFTARVLHRTITDLERAGKYLLLKLDNDIRLVFHLRMTGQLVYCESDSQAENAHRRLVLQLNNGGALVFSDTRTFGTVYAMEPQELKLIQGLAELGPEPLTEQFSPAYLTEAAAGKKTKIKSFLLDQRKIGGLGNIYADEALFCAGINPQRQAGSLAEAEIQRLYQAVNKVIADGIKDGGTTFRDYRDGDGNRGSHQEHLFVYGRGGEPCRTCGTAIAKIKLGGRGTCFCPVCQV